MEGVSKTDKKEQNDSYEIVHLGTKIDAYQLDWQKK